jgi:predicted nucleic-acid-binding Zn-ribbon protein
LSKVVAIEGRRPRGGEYKRPMTTLTCEKCQYTAVGMREISPCIKHMPDGISKVGQEKMKNMFTCPKCNYEAEWLGGTKRLNAGLARDRLMARTWGCSAAQRSYIDR